MVKIKKTLGEMLLTSGVITSSQLEDARNEEKKTGQSMRQALLKLEIINEEDLVNFIAQEMDMPRIELNNYLI